MTNEIIASSQAPEQLDSGEVTIYSPPPASSDPRDMLIPRTMADLGTLANVFSQAGMYASEGKPLSKAACAAIILTGIDLGLTPSQAMRGIRVIKGQPSPSADTLVACVRKRKDVCEYITVLESSATICKIAGKRVGDTQPTITQFSLEDAKAAQLTSSPMYAKYPEQMLYARCAVKLIRRLWPDVALGLYTPDELRDGRVNEEEADIVMPPSGPIRQIQPDSPPPSSTPIESSPTSQGTPFDTPVEQPRSAQPESPLKAQRAALNARVASLIPDDKEQFKLYAQAAFGGKFMPAVFNTAEIADANTALDRLAADPFINLLEEFQYPQGKGHGD